MTNKLSFRVKRSKTKKSVRKDYNKPSLFLRSLHFGRDDKNKNGRSSIRISLHLRLLRMTGVVISLILILSLIPILSNIKQSSRSNAEQVGSSPNNTSTSRIKQIYDDLVALGTNYGIGTNYWDRIESSAKWNPDDVTTTPDQVECGVEYYADNDRQKQTGTKDCPTPPINYTRGSDVYITGSDFTAGSIGQIGGTNCQATKFISSSKLRCTIPPKPHNSTQTITVTTAGTANSNQTVTYNNNSQGNMQDFTSLECDNLNRGQAIVLTDSRISKGETEPRTYRIKKMADDKCWMIDNLRYADDSWVEPGNNEYMTNDGTDNTHGPAGTNYDAYRYKNPGSSIAGCSPGSSSNCRGYLYNWYTATGGTGLQNISSKQNVFGNICPNNKNSVNVSPNYNEWQLPTGGGSQSENSTDNSDLAILNSAMHDDTGNNAPPTTGLSAISYSSQHPTYHPLWQPNNTFQGSFAGSYSSSLYGQGSRAFYWTATNHSKIYAKYAAIESSFSSPGSYWGNNYDGRAIRCLVR